MEKVEVEIVIKEQSEQSESSAFLRICQILWEWMQEAFETGELQENPS